VGRDRSWLVNGGPMVEPIRGERRKYLESWELERMCACSSGV